MLSKKVELSDYNNQVLLVGNLSMFDERVMILRAIDLPVIPEGTRVVATLYDSYEGLSKFEASVTFSISNQIKLQVSKSIGTVERRQHLKIPTNFETTIDNFILGNGRKMPVRKKIFITVENISLGGFFFVSDELFGVGQRFDFMFEEAGDPVTLVAEIVRTQKVERFTMGYGCRFIDLTTQDRDLINKYTIQLQMKQIRRVRR